MRKKTLYKKTYQIKLKLHQHSREDGTVNDLFLLSLLCLLLGCLLDLSSLLLLSKLLLSLSLGLSELDGLVLVDQECSEDLLLDALVASDSSVCSCDCSLVLWDPLVFVWSEVSDSGKEASTVAALDAGRHLALVVDSHVAAGCLDDSDGIRSCVV